MRALATPVRARNLRDSRSMTKCRDLVSRSVVGSLILDSKGVIHCCSAAVARLAGMAEGEITGRAIKFLIPDFPLNTETQGYNVAFVSFLTASGCAHKATLVRADGDTLPIEAWTNLLRVNKEYLLCLELRCMREPQRSEARTELRPLRRDTEMRAAAEA